MIYDRDTLVLTHMQLAHDIAIREWRTAPHALEKDNMISLANNGLFDAAERWVPYCKKKGYDPEAIQFFKAYAAFRIRGNIRDEIRKEDWATRTLRSKAKKLKEAGQDEGLTVDELAYKTGMTVHEINKVNARLAARPISLDIPRESSSEHQLKEDVDTEGIAFANSMVDAFVLTYKQLEPDVKVVLALHYYSRLDLRKVADQLGIAETKVSQLHTSGVLAVREALTKAATERD